MRALAAVAFALAFLAPIALAEPPRMASAAYDAADESCAWERNLLQDCRLEVEGVLEVDCVDAAFCRFTTEGVATSLDDVPTRDVSVRLRVGPWGEAAVGCTSVAPGASRCPFELMLDHPFAAGACLDVALHARYAAAPGAATRADVVLTSRACRDAEGGVTLAPMTDATPADALAL